LIYFALFDPALFVPWSPCSVSPALGQRSASAPSDLYPLGEDGQFSDFSPSDPARVVARCKLGEFSALGPIEQIPVIDENCSVSGCSIPPGRARTVQTDPGHWTGRGATPRVISCDRIEATTHAVTRR
jgi:hypothetical protein